MSKLKQFFYILLLLASTQILLVSCDGEILLRILNLGLTDAPFDDPLYGDVYVTIDEIKIDGESIKGFDRQSINVSRLQNGLTETLFEEEVPVGTYEEISLVLDFDKDASGEVPGCYINTSYGRKISLANFRTGKKEVEIKSNFEVSADGEAQFVIDFDLRKVIRSGQPGDEEDMNFVELTELGEALNVIDVPESGSFELELSLDASLPQTALFYLAYLYPKGSFDRETEFFDGDGDGITFENASSSGKLLFSSTSGQSSLTIPYVPEGEYDLVIEAYERYEVSQFRLGFLTTEGQELLTKSLSIKKGENTKLSLTGNKILP